MFEPDIKVDTLTQAVKLHLSSDDYKGELLVVDKPKEQEGGAKKKDDADSKQVFRTTRMLPPGDVFYYYTIDGKAQ